MVFITLLPSFKSQHLDKSIKERDVWYGSNLNIIIKKSIFFFRHPFFLIYSTNFGLIVN